MSENDDNLPALARYFAAGVNGLTGKAVEGILIIKGADPLLAATAGGSLGEMVKESVLAGARRLLRRRMERLSDAFEAAEQESDGWTPAELFEHALDQDDERRLDLFVNAFSAAASETNRRRVRAYGRMVARGVLADDDAKVDETTRIFGTLAALDEADLKALDAMGREPFEGWLIDEPQAPGPFKIFRRDLAELGDVVDAVVSRLEGAGLISRGNGEGLAFGPEPYRLTRYGKRCFEELLRGEDAGS